MHFLIVFPYLPADRCETQSFSCIFHPHPLHFSPGLHRFLTPASDTENKYTSGGISPAARKEVLVNGWRTLVWLVALLGLSPISLGRSLALPETAAKPTSDRTLSPYFFVQSGAEGVEPLPLKSTAAVVDIAGVIADVKVTQRYKNEGRTPIEAIYVFPGSTRAAVYGMKMKSRRKKRLPVGTATAQRLPDERGQHHAGRRDSG
jgi:hypothetical protein